MWVLERCVVVGKGDGRACVCSCVRRMVGCVRGCGCCGERGEGEWCWFSGEGAAWSTGRKSRGCFITGCQSQ